MAKKRDKKKNKVLHPFKGVLDGTVIVNNIFLFLILKLI